MHSSSEKNQAKRQTIVKVVLLIIVIAITVLIVALGWSRFKKDSPVKQTAQTQGQTTTTPTNTPQPQTTPKPAEQPKAPVTTWPVKLSMSEAASTTVVVNKKHQLPSAYVPAGLVAYGAGQIKSEAAQALTKLFSAAQEQGFTLAD